MKIGIIGGGAVGLLFSVYYSLEHDVTLLVRTKEQATVLNSIGIQFVRDNQEEVFNIKATDQENDLFNHDLIVVAVKQYQLDSLMDVLCKLPQEIPLLFVQNGMGHLEKLERLPQTTIFVGTVEHGVKKSAQHIIHHTGIGVVNVGLYRGEKTSLANFPIVNHHNFLFEIHDQYLEFLQSKLIANAMINPLTAIFHIKNGELLENHYYYRIFLQLFEEISLVFPQINKVEILDKVIMICRQTKDNTSSMLADIEEGRETEIDSIMGYIISKGNEKGLNLPVTSLIYNMVKGKELEAKFID